MTTPHDDYRKYFLPANAIRVADKETGAVVYIWTNNKGQDCAAAFTAKAQKPAWHYRFLKPADRERRVTGFFASVREHKARVAERRQKRNQPHKLQVGHILNTCWGYDQTNREFFEVTKLIGKTTVELRELAQVSSETGWMTGNCSPKAGKYVGDPIRRRVDATCNGIRIDSVRYASLWDCKPKNWSSYA